MQAGKPTNKAQGFANFEKLLPRVSRSISSHLLGEASSCLFQVRVR
jgi:hypothetical protein